MAKIFNDETWRKLLEELSSHEERIHGSLDYMSPDEFIRKTMN